MEDLLSNMLLLILFQGMTGLYEAVSFDDLPFENKVIVARYLGSKRNRHLAVTNLATSAAVDSAREFERPNDLREIYAEFKQLIDETDLTAEMILDFCNPIPERLSLTMPARQYPYLHPPLVRYVTVARPMNLGRLSLRPQIGSYLIIKVYDPWFSGADNKAAKNYPPNYKLMFFKFKGGRLIEGQYFDRVEWVPMDSSTEQIQWMFEKA